MRAYPPVPPQKPRPMASILPTKRQERQYFLSNWSASRPRASGALSSSSSTMGGFFFSGVWARGVALRRIRLVLAYPFSSFQFFWKGRRLYVMSSLPTSYETETPSAPGVGSSAFRLSYPPLPPLGVTSAFPSSSRSFHIPQKQVRGVECRETPDSGVEVHVP